MVAEKPHIRKTPDLRIIMAAADFEDWFEACLKGEFDRAVEPMKRLRSEGVQVLYRHKASRIGGGE